MTGCWTGIVTKSDCQVAALLESSTFCFFEELDFRMGETKEGGQSLVEADHPLSDKNLIFSIKFAGIV
jgi:hypothetical protein